MINNLQFLEFKSFKELKDYCINNNILKDLNDEDYKYLFENVLNYSDNKLSEDKDEDLINPYQYTL